MAYVVTDACVKDFACVSECATAAIAPQQDDPAAATVSQVYINPETVSGIAISLQIVFAVIAGGMFIQLGPTVGALFTILLTESLRITVGHEVHGLDGTIYGLLLVIFIIYMPKGILGALVDLAAHRSTPPPPGRLQPAREAAE